MIIYYLLFLSFPFFYCIFGKVTCFGNEKMIRACIYGTFIFLILALRHPTMGIDLNPYGNHGYIPSFYFFSSLSFKDLIGTIPLVHAEPGYVFMNWLLVFLSSDSQILLIACAFLSIIPIAVLFYKESDSLELSYIIYLSLQSFLICFSGLRQGIAVGICMIAFLFLLKRNSIKFFLFVLFATLFHSSSILFLIAYPLYYLKIKKDYRWLTVLVLVISFVFKGPLFSVLSKILKENAVANEAVNTPTYFIVFSAVYIFCFTFAEDKEENNGFLNLVFLACFCLAFSNIFSIAIRAGYFFMNFLPLILPRAINGIDNRYFKIVVHIIVVFSFSIFALNSLSSSFWAMSNPYHFFWE